jgi:hypothetical protein
LLLLFLLLRRSGDGSELWCMTEGDGCDFAFRVLFALIPTLVCGHWRGQWTEINSHYLPPTRVYMGIDCVEMAGALGYEAPFTARLLA